MNKFFIGLVLGIAIAGGLAVYLNNTPMQFAIKGVNNTPNPTLSSSNPVVLVPSTKLQIAKSSDTTKQFASGPNNASATAANYQFYNILQGESTTAEQHVSTSTPTPQILGFMVQAGAFTTDDAANNMQGQLALLGISSTIKTENNHNHTINRVLIGPLNTESEADAIINKLSDEKVNAILLRITS